MRNFYYLIIITIFTVSCNTLNRAEKHVNSGDYDEAFDLLIKKYQKGISDKNYGKLLPTFQKAYLKMVDNEEDKIERLKLDNSPANYGRMYEILVRLDRRQTKLKALLPIQYNGKTYHFPTKNYAPAIADIKHKYTTYLVEEGDVLIERNNIDDARQAYKYYSKVIELNKAYPYISEKLQNAHNQGTEFVLIEFKNKSNQVIPQNLLEELTDIDTYGIDDFWTEFHNKKNQILDYDYLVRLNFDEILVSPERQNTVVHNFEKQIIDGWEFLYQNGQQVVDSLGNPIKVDRHITVRGRLAEVMLEKDAYLEGRAQIINLRSQQNMLNERLHTEFAFRDRYANFEGDPRAIDGEYRDLVNRRPIGFPSNEQMVYDCGEEIKDKLKHILRKFF